MKTNYKLRDINIKNGTCYYFDDIIELEDFDLNNILIGRKSYENIGVYGISYKNFIGTKPMRITLNKIEQFTRDYDRTRDLVLFGGEKYDFIYNRIRNLVGVKSDNRCVSSHNYAKIKVHSYDSFSLEKTFTFHNVIRLIKSVFIKDKNSYYYNILLEKCSYQLPKNNDNT